MAKIVFFEKPGCANNTRQKALLAAAGHEVDARNLLTEAWTPERLRPFFGSRPVADATPPAKGWETCTKGVHAKACTTKDKSS